MHNASSQQVRTLQVPSFVDCMESTVYERKQVSKGDDPRTIWGSSDESVDDNSVIDDDYEPSGTGSEEGEFRCRSPDSRELCEGNSMIDKNASQNELFSDNDVIDGNKVVGRR